MGIRQTLNENPAITTAVTGLIIAAALGFVLRQACAGPGANGRRGPAVWPTKYYFTVDDGKTWFPEDAKRIPPFDFQGKQAYRARIFRCPDGKEHVSHLERYAAADKKRFEEVLAKQPERSVEQLETTVFLGVKEVKEAGAKDWVKMSGANIDEYTKIQQPKCPDGTITGLEWVTPG